MVAGHLQEKYGYFYAVLNYTDENGKRKTKWIATGLEVKGNKKRAEAILLEQRHLFEQKLSEIPVVNKDDILFADYMVMGQMPQVNSLSMLKKSAPPA